MPENNKSVTIKLSFGSNERTLSDSEINEALAKITKSLERKGGKLRS